MKLFREEVNATHAAQWLGGMRLHRPLSFTLGADKGYGAREFFEACTAMNITSHVAQNILVNCPTVPAETACSQGYAISQQKRKFGEQGFGWAKTVVRVWRVMLRWQKKVDQMFVLTMAAYNLTRMRSLVKLCMALAACQAAPLCAAYPPDPCANYAADLAAMIRADQALRSRVDVASFPQHARNATELPRIAQQVMLIDRVNTERLKALVLACGWPKRSVHGSQAVGDAWLLAQHADMDPRFQRIVLAIVEKAVAAGEAPVDHLAYLADRVQTSEGKPQLYGTQTKQKGPCEFDFLPLDDRRKVEERRKSIGWPSLEEYKKLVNQYMLPASCRLEQKDARPESELSETSTPP